MGSLARLLRFTKNLAPYYAIIVISSILVALAGIAIPFIIGNATDAIVHAIQSGQTDVAGKVVWLAAAFFAVDLLSTTASSIGNYYGDVMSQKMRAILSSRYFRKLLALPQSYFDDELTGTITSRLNRSIAEVTNFAKMFSNSLFTVALTTIAVLVISAIYSPWLAFLLLFIFPTYLWLTMLTSRGWQVYETQKNQKVDEASGRFMEVVGQIKVVKSFVQELRELTNFSVSFGETVSLTERQSRYWHTMDFIRRAFMGLMFFGIYAIIFVNTSRGVFSVGDMILLIQLIAMARQPIANLSWIVDTSQRAITGSNDFFAVMEKMNDVRPAIESEIADAEKLGNLAKPVREYAALRPLSDDASSVKQNDEGIETEDGGVSWTESDNGASWAAKAVADRSASGTGDDAAMSGQVVNGVNSTSMAQSASATGSAERAAARDGAARSTGGASEAGASAVSFEHVYFGYEGGDDVVRDVSFEVHAGEHVAFVSESGGGKSTLTSLLLGLYEPRSGRISVFGRPTSAIPVAELRRRIGVVFQDASLFSGTVEENIAYGRQDAARQDVVAAAERANADSFVRKLPEGYQTVIGERGLKLSGGQRQRIAVARAILKDADILVLDEATSALDTRSERMVQAGLDSLMEGRTSIIIAHRLSTIAEVDRIITLKDGRIDEIGTPAELAATGGIYATLLALQSEGTKSARRRLRKYGFER
jgi:ABC-type multidrug transport system, ATPase and permease components